MRFSIPIVALLIPTILASISENDADFYHKLAMALTTSAPYTRNTVNTDFYAEMARRLVNKDNAAATTRDLRRASVEPRDGGNDFFDNLAAAMIRRNKMETRNTAINITKTEIVNADTGVGELAWGASRLALGYEAGAGINFDAVNGTIGGGFNAGVPGRSEGALGGGWTISKSNLTLGLGAVVGNKSISISVVGGMESGKVSVVVNGREVEV